MKTESDETLAIRIRGLIADKSIASFARKCGVEGSLLRKYLAGSQPNAANLVKIADAAGVTIDWLAAGREPKIAIPFESFAAQAGAKMEGELITFFSEMNQDQRAAVLCFVFAVKNPGMITKDYIGESVSLVFNSVFSDLGYSLTSKK